MVFYLRLSNNSCDDNFGTRDCDDFSMIGCDDILSATGYDDDFDLIYVFRTIAAMIALACAIAMILIRPVATMTLFNLRLSDDSCDDDFGMRGCDDFGMISCNNGLSATGCNDDFKAGGCDDDSSARS